MKGKIVSKVLFETDKLIFGSRIKTCTDNRGLSYAKKEPFVRLKQGIKGVKQ